MYEKLGQLEAIASPSMTSDIRVGRLMAGSAVRGALENVAINLESITDAGFAAKMRPECERLGARVSEGAVATSR
jgi:formiminotetrahydrofolate cyclodeaminase